MEYTSPSPVLEKNNDLTRNMITQTGYGLGSTAIRSMATAPILFNSRSLDALGINEGSIPTFSLINTDGVWEDNTGSFGVMRCLISLLTNKNK